MTAAAPESSQRNYRFFFWLLLTATTLVRLALADSIGLGVDESHYALYARRMAWGYLDHPPMVSWLAAPGLIYGDTSLPFRFLPILCNALSLVLLRALAIQLWKDERVAFWALAVLTLLPYQHLLMVALLPDAGLNLFWCATLLSFRHAILGSRRWPWALTGLFWGMALLAKYHALLLPVCMAGYLLTSRTQRRWLKKPLPYAALAIGMCVYSPNLIWNAENGWISYLFHLNRAGAGGFGIGNALSAIGGQLAAWSPLMLGLLVAAFAVIVRRAPPSDRQRFVLWFSLPVFAFFVGIGFFGKVLPHWTSPGWWCGSLALASITLSKVSAGNREAVRWRRTFTIGAVVGLSMTAALYVCLYQPIVEPVYRHLRSASLRLNRHIPSSRPLPPYQPKFDISNDLFGWNETAVQVNSILQTMPRPQETFIFTHRFFEASQLAIHLPEDVVVTTLGRRADQYRLWFDPDEYLGWDALFLDVDRRRQGPGRYRSLFEQAQADAGSWEVKRDGRPIRQISLHRYSGYRGRYQR